MMSCHGFLKKNIDIGENIKQEKPKSQSYKFWQKIVVLLGIVGPGLITANIDNDAGGIATYSLAGASTGYRLLWVLFPLMVQ